MQTFMTEKSGTMEKAGTGEKLQYLTHEFNDNTIRFILHYPGLIQAEYLREATKDLVESTELLHSSFMIEKGKAYWKHNEEYGPDSFFELIHTEKNLMEEAAKKAIHPVKPEGEVQLFCTLIQNESESAIVFNVSHLCVDGMDGKYLLHKLLEAYHLRKSGSEDLLVVKNGSRDVEQIYAALDKKEIRSLLKSPISDIKSEFPFRNEEGGVPILINTKIPSRTIQSAKTKLKKVDASVNDLLLAACYHAYAKLPGIDTHQPISIMSMMDLRRHCKEGDSEGLSNLTGSLPTELREGVGETLAETISHIAAQTHSLKDNPLAGLEGMPLLHGLGSKLPINFLLKVAGKIYGSFPLGVTNLGRFSSDELTLDEMKPLELYFAGPAKKKPGAQVSIVSLDDACYLAVAGEYAEEDVTLLNMLLDSMVEEVTKYAEE